MLADSYKGGNSKLTCTLNGDVLLNMKNKLLSSRKHLRVIQT